MSAGPGEDLWYSCYQTDSVAEAAAAVYLFRKCLLAVVAVVAAAEAVRRDFQEVGFVGFVVEVGRTNCLQEVFDFVVGVDQISYQEEESGSVVVEVVIAVDRIDYRQEGSGFAVGVVDRTSRQ